MALLFDRTYRLRIGTAGELGLDITELHVEFKVDKSDKAEDKNKATITIVNLSSKSIDRIERDQAVIFEAGYGDERERRTIFIGQVESVSSILAGQVVRTTIKCIDGYIPLREGYTAQAFPAKTSVRTMLQTLITQDLGFAAPQLFNGTLGDSKGLNKEYQSGSAKIGQTSDIISALCKDNFLTWLIREGNVLVYPVDGSTDIEVPLISAASGMIGSPQRAADNGNKSAGSLDLKVVYKVKTLLDGTYNIGDLVRVESVFTNGIFRISKVSHQGSFEGPEWVSNLTLAEGVSR